MHPTLVLVNGTPYHQKATHLSLLITSHIIEEDDLIRHLHLGLALLRPSSLSSEAAHGAVCERRACARMQGFANELDAVPVGNLHK
eukprot:1157587-Pelagomonas_calceolata.AAC.3